MKKIMLFLTIMILSIQLFSPASADSNKLKAAFVRNDNLWIKIDDQEMRITHDKYVRYPKWSFDGGWIAYIKGNKVEESPLNYGELWLYNVKLNKHFKVSSNVGTNFKWSPNQNSIAFETDNVLKMINSHYIMQQYKIATGIIDFSWLPHGNGFLTSSKASGNVYSDILLTKYLLNNNQYQKQHFYTIKVRENEHYYGTSQFKWSEDQRWIAFQLVPTASLSADSNTLAVLSRDALSFKKIDEMLNYEDWFQWAPNLQSIAYISGDFRSSIKNKKLVIKKMINGKASLTPKEFVDRDLAWKSNHQIFVSRSIEGDWVESRSIEGDWVDELNRPMPSIYQINLQTNKQKKITFPNKNEGDFYPINVNNGDKLIWIRTNRKQACVFILNINGKNQRKWINKIDLGSWYYEHWNWNEVFSLYQS